MHRRPVQWPPSLLRDTTGLRHPYDPAQHARSIAPDRDRVLIFVGDPQDTVAPYALQRRFASALMQAGHAVLIKPVEARGSACPRYRSARPGAGGPLREGGVRQTALLIRTPCTDGWP